ncbi:hypothetical protein GCM10010468_46180 [Actinocorallia longicatena]|uniref:Uncharacterized protein n=1 Tax=Actinocorallia longicatena TaxID=111803 RepID=A0ABP6QD43_9ACTN
MIPFITPKRGKDTVRLVEYLFGKGRFNEHTNQRIITDPFSSSGDLVVL